ncbi:MAG: carboxylesterase/lipase family protein [Myxococcota bacterium]
MRAICLASIGLVLAACSSDNTADTPTSARTSLGVANGVMTDEGVVEFLGLRFAEPPVGELRFRPPVPIARWDSPVDASEFGPACVQPDDLEQSEDCLTLNVWTPAADDQKRPVMVWVHGGGWVYETTRYALYRGAHLAARGDVVVVSMEYRLGAFGFSHFEDIPGSGNAGILDQKLALEWVQEHIEAFGGDPDNVTIFGESAGGMSVTALMGMPGTEGLFHKVIAQSGAGSTAREPVYASAVADQFLEAAGVSGPEELVELTTDQLSDAQNELLSTAFVTDLMFGPVVDGDIFPEPPIQAIADGAAAEIPLLTGTTRDETRAWIRFVDVLANVEFEAVTALVPTVGRAIPDGRTEQDVVDRYQAGRPGAEPGVISHAAGTDVFFRMPAIRLVEAHLPHQPNNTFLYRFDWPPPVPESPYDLGAMHASELGFMLGGGSESWPQTYGSDPLPGELVGQMMDAWLSFAETGNPNHPDLPEWPAYELDARATMLFDAVGDDAISAVDNDPDGSERQFWDTVPFDGTRPTAKPEDL